MYLENVINTTLTRLLKHRKLIRVRVQRSRFFLGDDFFRLRCRRRRNVLTFDVVMFDVVRVDCRHRGVGVGLDSQTLLVLVLDVGLPLLPEHGVESDGCLSVLHRAVFAFL